jgi:death-on-curing protein
MKIIYFSNIDEVILLHKKTIEISGGGTTGILNLNSLLAALEHIQNEDYYPTFEEKLTHLFFVANKGHCFSDGNKRIAITLGSMFLLKNGYLVAAREFLFRMETISYHVAAGKISKELLLELVSSIMHEPDFNEDLKLKLIKSIDY